MKFSYNWLQSYFKKPLPAPEEISKMLINHAFEVEAVDKTPTDFLFEIKILPDRFADASSHYGLAREIAGLFGFKIEKLIGEEHKGKTADLAVEIKSQKCRRYLGQKIENVQIGPSPDWLRKSLEVVGVRSINNIVDATNFIMLSVGQPLHAFDADKLAGSKIFVKEAKTGETISLLEEKGKTGERKITLSGGELLIADEEGNLALAGVKGGRRAEITNTTKNIILESANFDPVSVGKTSRKFGILTDSSRRFENNLSPELAEEALILLVDLIISIAGGEAKKTVDLYPKKQKPAKLKVSLKQINNLLGTELKSKEVTAIFNRYNFDFKETKDIFEIRPPFYRQDLRINEDIIEEIGRIYGYDKIPEKLRANPTSKPNKEFYYATRFRHFLRDLGFSEIYTYALGSKGEMPLKNPLAADKKFLRSNLTESFKSALAENNLYLPLLGSDEVLILEIGKVFKKNKEYNSLCLGTPAKAIDKIASELEKKFGIDLSEADKIFFEKFAVLEINFDELISSLKEPKSYEDLDLAPMPKVHFKNISAYPFIARDIAVWLPSEEESRNLVKILEEESGKLLTRPPRLFDTYQKEGKISYAYRLVFQSREQTLTDSEVSGIMKKIEERLVGKGWSTR